MKRRTPTLGLLFALLVCGCRGSPSRQESQGVGSRTLEPWGGEPSSRTRLYARDGSPVPDQAGGSVTTAEGVAQHGPDAEDGSRPYLLELYQSAVDQKEKLELEVTALHRQIEDAGQQLSAQEVENDALALRVRALETEAAGREGENLELAARLATAQIRRLEAEKLLLETTLDWTRFQAQQVPTSGEESAVESGGEEEH